VDELTAQVLSALLTRLGDPIVISSEELLAAADLPVFVVNVDDGRTITRINPMGE